MAWYKKTFGKEYLRIYGDRDAKAAAREVEFLLDVLKPRADAWILDLACGAGRHVFSLIERGFRNVIGFDLSVELLEVARAEGRRRESPALFVRGDMRHLPFRERFDAALSMFTSFGYFESDEENALVLAGIARALKAGGAFVMDLPNAAHVAANLVAESVGEHERGRLIQRRKLRKENGRVEKQIIVESAGNGEVVHEFFESVRLYSLEEISGMLGEAGLLVERCCGDFEGGEATRISHQAHKTPAVCAMPGEEERDGGQTPPEVPKRNFSLASDPLVGVRGGEKCGLSAASARMIIIGRKANED